MKSTLPTSAVAFVVTVVVGTALAAWYQNTLRETVNELDACKYQILGIFDYIAKAGDPTDEADYGAATFKQLRPILEYELAQLHGARGLKRCRAILKFDAQTLQGGKAQPTQVDLPSI